MNYTKSQENIQETIFQLFQQSHVQYFPLDCFQLIEDCGYRIMTYQQMKQTNIQLYEYCRLLSDDAFHFKPKKLVAYNEDQSFYRIRFSLMHELGHILLNHEGDRRENEQEANYFASHILAPRMAVHYANPKDARELSSIFQISHEAADIALCDSIEWYRDTKYHMSDLDWKMYRHFYNKTQKCFVYHRAPCFYCLKPAYNLSYKNYSKLPLCTSCLRRQFRQNRDIARKMEQRDPAFRAIRNWEDREVP